MLKCLQLGEVHPGRATLLPQEEVQRVRAMISDCRGRIAGLRTRLGVEPDGALLGYQAIPDGSLQRYYLVCHYDPSIPSAAEYALRVEREAPPLIADQNAQARSAKNGNIRGRV